MENETKLAYDVICDPAEPQKKDPIDEKRCHFFEVCGARIIREKQERIELPAKKWADLFCLGDFGSCIHYQRRVEEEVKKQVSI
jgi:hypothetical protein